MPEKKDTNKDNTAAKIRGLDERVAKIEKVIRAMFTSDEKETDARFGGFSTIWGILLAGAVGLALMVGSATASSNLLWSADASEGNDAWIRLRSDDGDDANDDLKLGITSGNSFQIRIGNAVVLSVDTSGNQTSVGVQTVEHLNSTDDVNIQDDLNVTGSVWSAEAAIFDGGVIVTSTTVNANNSTVNMTNVTMNLLGSTVRVSGVAGTKILAGIPISIEFRPTTGETLAWTVPSGFDLLVHNAYGWKTAASGSDAEDQWAVQNNDGSAANIFDVEELAGVTDKAMAQFDNLDDAEAEVAAGDTLDLVAGEATDDDGADGIIIVEGILKVAD